MRRPFAPFFLSLAALLLASCSSSSSSSGGNGDSGARGDGGCLLDTPTKGAPCTGDEVLCNPGSICCGGEWRCDPSSHTWNLLQGGCACGPDDTGTPDTGSGADTSSDAATD